MLFTKKNIYAFATLTLFYLNIYSQTTNSIDATSSASRKFKIAGGVVNENSATVRWSGQYNNGNLEIKWGTSSSSLKNSKSMYPYSKGKTAEIVFSNLEPDTKYFYRVDGEYERKKYTNLMSGSFTTTDNSVTEISSLVTNNKIPQSFVLSKNKLRTNLLFVPGDIIYVINSKGAMVKKIPINSFRRETDVSFLGNGHYVFKLFRKNNMIHQSNGSKL